MLQFQKPNIFSLQPRIRKTGQDLKAEVDSKFKDAVKQLKKDSSFINCLPTGFRGNDDHISVLKHVTGHEVGKEISYFYFPINDLK